MNDLRAALIEALQIGGMNRVVSEIRAAVPPAIIPDLARRLMAGQDPRPGDQAAPITTR